MRAAVLERDGGCRWQGCSETYTVDELEVHHTRPIEEFPELADVLDLQVTLCPMHHLKAAELYRAGVPTDFGG